MADKPPEKIKISLEDKKKEEERHHSHHNVEEKNERQETISEIIDHLLLAEDKYLLQLSPIPKNTIFDICYDVTQRAVLNKERKDANIPLSEIFYETYLRAVRGSNQTLARGIIDMAGMQIQTKGDSEPIDTVSR